MDLLTGFKAKKSRWEGIREKDRARRRECGRKLADTVCFNF